MARRLGMDMERFGADLSAHRHAEKIKKDVAGALSSHAETVPTLFIDGERYRRALNGTAIAETLMQRIGAANFASARASVRGHSLVYI